ncbi:hypothetical protein TspCOW1_30730 [Thiohalobacter sp. COW1]|uniref:hypothetical protein n=1 Tax=Thiohalobacter sp. COW1 TaxID=2795687 RepID=UPI001916A25E|nr:hypothetical protein [Thiohalobacter sp. COW1]BCO32970.1 hypothetical protein TspCOW1_30730 [Thiohalobacter sp. COW1]
MSFVDLLFQPRLLLALLAFVLVSSLFALAELRLEPHYHQHPASAWIADHIFIPLAEVLALLAFLLLAYPVPYGLTTAPGMLELLSADGRITDLINLLFLLSLLLPLLPGLGQLPGVVLLVQALAATALLFHWLGQRLQLEVSLAPGWLALGLILIWAWVGQRLVRRLAPMQGEALTPGRILHWHLTGAVQLPAILIYGQSLGRQLG